jgi:hypothetical protein
MVLCGARSRGNFSKCYMKMLLTMGERELPIAMPSFVVVVVVGRTCRPPENMWFSSTPSTVP